MHKKQIVHVWLVVLFICASAVFAADETPTAAPSVDDAGLHDNAQLLHNTEQCSPSAVNPGGIHCEYLIMINASAEEKPLYKDLNFKPTFEDKNGQIKTVKFKIDYEVGHDEIITVPGNATNASYSYTTRVWHGKKLVPGVNYVRVWTDDFDEEWVDWHLNMDVPVKVNGVSKTVAFDTHNKGWAVWQVGASTFTATHDKTLSSGDANSNWNGAALNVTYIINTTNRAYISKVTPYSGGTASKVLIFNSSGTVICKFDAATTTRCELPYTGLYYIMHGSDGTSYTRRWGAGAYPYATTNANWLYGKNNLALTQGVAVSNAPAVGETPAMVDGRNVVRADNETMYWINVGSVEITTYYIDDPAWFSSSMNFSINSTVSSLLGDFPARVVFNTGALVSQGRLQSDCRDLRVSANISENIAHKMTYTVSPAPSGSYPDTGGVEFTDSHYDGPAYIDGRSFGYNNAASAITVNLGSAQNITFVRAAIGTHPAAGAVYPTAMTASFSNSSSGPWVSSTTFSCPADAFDSMGWCNATVSVNAQYVKIDAPNPGAAYWVMYREVQVFDAPKSRVLDYEVEGCNAQNTTIWFRVPFFNRTMNGTIYYGNNTAADRQRVAGVWRGGYTSIFHFNGTANDALGSFNPTTVNGITYASGMFGNGAVFDASTDYIDFNTGMITLGSGSYLGYTVTMLANVSAYDANDELWRIYDNSPDSTDSFSFSSPNGVWTRYNAGADSCTASYANYVGKYIPIAFAVWPNTPSNMSWLVNGSQACSFSTSKVVAPPWTSITLMNSDSRAKTRAPTGTIDELRVSPVRRNDDWIKAEYAQTYSEVATVKANETNAVSAIVAGLQQSVINPVYSVAYNRQVHVRTANGSQYQDRFDVFVQSGNNRWAFNYDQNASATFQPFVNISPVFYVWQAKDLSETDITLAVAAFVNSTASGVRS